MKKLLVFIGESGSGKTTIIAELSGRYPEQFKKVVTCTNRPKRTGEMEGIDYHFLPEEYFIGNPELVLTKRMSDGFYYGTRNTDLFPTSHHLLLTSKPTGVGKLVGLGCKGIIVVRISIDEQLKVERMHQRGDTEAMISNRVRMDAENAVETDLGQIPVIDLQASQPIEDKIESVLVAC